MPPRMIMSEKIEAYQHKDKRKNNPPVGLVTPETDGVEEKQSWAYDPHIDPALQFDGNANRAAVEKLIDDALESGDQASMQVALETLKQMHAPYLNWTGKAEKTSFEVDTVSLHVHERIAPATILQAVRHNLDEKKSVGDFGEQADLFDSNVFAAEPLREAVEFYKHDKGWANRMIAGDSLLVMNSLLQKESLAGQVQMIYIDPPYGIKYGSNFQPFVNKRDVKDRSDEDLTQEPEMIKAFRDTWELGIHSYLTYLRDRLLLTRELLAESGSVFVQISDENVHHVREIMDEVFGDENFVSEIIYIRGVPGLGDTLSNVNDFILWYSKNKQKAKYNPLFNNRPSKTIASAYNYVEEASGKIRRLTSEEIKGTKEFVGKRFKSSAIVARDSSVTGTFDFEHQNLIYKLPPNSHWKTSKIGLKNLTKCNRAVGFGKTLTYKMYSEDFPYVPISNVWDDVFESTFAVERLYVVQTQIKVIERCLLMTTAPGDLALDITCGSGTTAFVAEKWGRRWITCDTSRVAVTLAKQRLMTAQFDYFPLKYPDEGIKAGFIYKTVPHVTLKSIANNPDIDTIYEKLRPAIDDALAELNAVLKKSLPEWEVPFELPASWPETTKAPFEAFHKARQAMQAKMDAAIAANADQETLYDRKRP